MRLKNVCTIVAAGSALALGGVVSGQEYTWTAGGNDIWADGDNWNCVGGGCGGATYPGQLNNDAEVLITTAGPELAVNLANSISTLDIGGSGSLKIVNLGRLDISQVAIVAAGTTVLVEAGGILEVPGAMSITGTVEVEADALLEMQGGGSAGNGGKLIADGPVELSGLFLIADNRTFTLEGVGLEVIGTIQLEGSNAEFLVDGRLNIAQPGLLQVGTISAGGKVRFAYDAAPHAIAGAFVLANSDSEMYIDADTVFAPDGSGNYGVIEGLDSAARIVIADPGTSNTIRLTNQVEFHGGMIVGPPTSSPAGTVEFMNQRVSADPDSGVVLANDGLAITFAAGLVVVDEAFVDGTTYRPVWAVDGATSVLYFAGPEWTTSEGDFWVFNCGLLLLDETIETAGSVNDGIGSTIDGTVDTSSDTGVYIFAAGNMFFTDGCTAENCANRCP